jgi:hypothetical protein
MALDGNIRELLERYNSVAQAQTEDSVRALGDATDDMLGALREEIQSKTMERMQGIVEKLGSGIPLTSDDADLVRLWVVGDAMNYLRREDEYQNWLRDLSRLAGEIAGLNRPDLNVDELGKLQGAVSDMNGILPMVEKYAEQRDRVARFDKAVAKTDPQSLKFLQGVLQHKIDSPDD